MKKFLIIFLLLFSLINISTAFVDIVNATKDKKTQLNQNRTTTSPKINPLDRLQKAARQAGFKEKASSITEIVGNIIQKILQLVGVIAFIFVIYGGFLWMTAQGETSKIDKAKKILYDAILGLIIISFAYSITFFVIKNLIG